MKSLMPLILLVLSSVAFIQCNGKEDDNPVPVIKDIKFYAQITGDVNMTYEFVLPEGVSRDYTISGSYGFVDNMLLIIVEQLLPGFEPGGWAFSFAGHKSGGFSIGTYICSFPLSIRIFTTDSGDFNVQDFYSNSGQVEITRADPNELLDKAYWADGTFEYTASDNSIPPNVVQISGNFENILLVRK